MFPVRKKSPTINRVVAKTNQVICNSRSFKVSNIRPARKSAELVRRQHAWGAIACYPRRRRPNSAFSAIAVAADCSDRADSNRTLWEVGLGTSWVFYPKMSCLLFFALVLPFHFSEAYTVRPGRCPEYVMGESTYQTCQINPKGNGILRLTFHSNTFSLYFQAWPILTRHHTWVNGMNTPMCLSSTRTYPVSLIKPWYITNLWHVCHLMKTLMLVGGKCVRATYTNEGDEVGVFNEFVSPV